MVVWRVDLRRTALLLGLALAATSALAGTKKLTIADIYTPKKLATIVAPAATGLFWIDDTHFVWPRRDASNEIVAEVLVEARTGKEIALFDVDDLQARMLKIEGVSDQEAKKLARPRAPILSPKKDSIALIIKKDLYVYTISSKTLTRLTATRGEEELATFSPDGGSVAFIRDNDLYLIPVTGGKERAVTTGGSEDLLNGKLDWVYQEEIYGRDKFKAYWWSPDGKSIAWLQTDEKPVPKFAVVDHIPYHQKVELTGYPKSGDANPKVKLFVTNLETDRTAEVSQRGYENTELLIVDVAWTEDSKRVVTQFQDREQTWLDLLYADPSTGATTRILQEKTKAWVERTPEPTWLADGSFLWLSERDGYSHLYRVSPDGKQQTQLTRGQWEVRTVHGLDASGKIVYFSGTATSPIEVHLYRMRIDGSRMEKMTAAAGTHTVLFNPKMSLYLDVAGNMTTPNRVALHDSSGKLVRMVHQPPDTLSDYDLSTPELLKVPTRDGFIMEAILIRPAGFDPSKKYPVYQHTYSGPHAPQVRNAWGGSTYLFHQLLAQNGVAVWICDNRTASGKGAISAWPAYKRLGEIELRDLEDGLAWLKKQYPWVDGSRTLLNGWSYGGFMVSYALTHSKAWSAGIAGGSVTDWRDYDTVYTERYMLKPENNKEGYAKAAPRNSAANLHGRLLLIHGTLDDNVHMQNTIQFAHDLQQAGKQFELMLYPKSRHGVTDTELVLHLRQLMLDFVTRTLIHGSP